MDDEYEGCTVEQIHCDIYFGHEWPNPVGDEWVPCRICGVKARRIQDE